MQHNRHTTFVVLQNCWVSELVPHFQLPHPMSRFLTCETFTVTRRFFLKLFTNQCQQHPFCAANDTKFVFCFTLKIPEKLENPQNSTCKCCSKSFQVKGEHYFLNRRLDKKDINMISNLKVLSRFQKRFSSRNNSAVMYNI